MRCSGKSTQKTRPETIQTRQILKATEVQRDQISPFIHAASIYGFESILQVLEIDGQSLPDRERLPDEEN